MPPELYRRARRAEAGAQRAEDRRRLRLDFFRAALADGLDTLKQRHAGGASGQDSVRAHAAFMDELVRTIVRFVGADAEAAGLAPTPLVVVALGGYGRGELHPSSDIDLMVVYEGELSPYVQRTSVNFMGCYAAFNAIKLADAICKANPEAKVMMVCTEICTIHFQKCPEPDHLFSNALFGDGGRRC